MQSAKFIIGWITVIAWRTIGRIRSGASPIEGNDRKSNRTDDPFEGSSPDGEGEDAVFPSCSRAGGRRRGWEGAGGSRDTGSSRGSQPPRASPSSVVISYASSREAIRIRAGGIREFTPFARTTASDFKDVTLKFPGGRGLINVKDQGRAAPFRNHSPLLQLR